MKQYCRYCSHLVTGNGTYCDKKGSSMSESSAKLVNRCKLSDFWHMDAFDPDRSYKPREPKKHDCDGQLNLFNN